jgi:MFS family permease
VLLGILTVGKLEERWPKERIVASAFLAGGVVLIAISTYVTGWSVLVASFFVGLTFAWKKVPVDTLVQEALPDGYRGRVFAVYDVAYNVSRVIASFVAIPLVSTIGEEWAVALVGVAFLLYSPVLPRWLARAPEISLRFYEGARGEEVPRALLWGGVEELVEVEREWLEERDGARRRCFRLTLEDGTLLQVSRPEPDGSWRLDRELA